MKTYTVSVITPSIEEHNRVTQFVKEYNLTPVSEALTKDVQYSFILLELTEDQYSDLIDLKLNSRLTDIT